MTNVLAQAKAYLKQVLGGDSSRVKSWPGAGQLPYYLQQRYTFSCSELLGVPCLFMVCRGQDGETPAVVSKHWLAVSAVYPDDVIYLVQTLGAFNRKRLIEHKVPFIVPGNQLYLPMQGIDLREYFRGSKKTENNWLSAAAQVLVLREVLDRGSAPSARNAKELAKLLGYSAMTLTRAIKELVDRKLATAELVGREKRLVFTKSKQDLWQGAKPYIRNPVKRRIWVAGLAYSSLLAKGEAKLAGESALANNTTLADPKNPVVAINASDWPGIKKIMRLEERAQRDDDCVELELWLYNPNLITLVDSVDPLSLWLSLSEVRDERIEIALDALIENTWSKQRWLRD